MVGIRLIIIMAIVGGLIAYIADKMGTKIGKKKMSVFGLRPKYTSILLTVVSGTLIAVLTILVMSLASNSARTALFGLEQIQRELRELNAEKLAVGQALSNSKAKIEEQNEAIAALDAKIKESMEAKSQADAKLEAVNASYAQAKEEVVNLTKAKEDLSQDVEELEATTARLRQGIATMREGQVFYRAGEVVHAGVLRSGLKHDMNEAQVNWLLQNANTRALQRLGIIPKENEKQLQAIWLPQAMVDKAVKALDASKGNLLVRVRTAANIFVGELAVCELELAENQLIFGNNDLVHEETIALAGKENPGEDRILMGFLSQLNGIAVKAGVLPDPLTGQVGNIDAATMIEATHAMQRCKGNYKLQAYAKGDITTAGPVLVRLEVVKLGE